jgi:fructokinase
MISLGRMGVPGVMITETGDDHVGDIVRDFLIDNNINTDYVYRHKGTKSHLSLAFLDANNDAQYQFYKDHWNIAMPQEMPQIERGDIVIYGSFYCVNPKIRDFSRRFLEKAHKQGAFLYYDINFRASHKEDIPDIMENITENMRLASVVRGSNEDFEILYGAKTCDEAYNIVKEYCPYFIYTNADKPVELRTPNLRVSFPVKQVETVSTIGAGDNFNAGFCYAIYKEGVASLETIKKEEELAAFSRFIASGQKFSSVVCQSLDNYVPKDFRP